MTEDKDAANMSLKDKLKLFEQQKVMGTKSPDVRISPSRELPAPEHSVVEPPPQHGSSVPHGGKHFPGFEWSVEMKMSRASDSEEEVDKSEMDKGDDFKSHVAEEKAEVLDDGCDSEPDDDAVVPDTHAKEISKSPDCETSQDEETEEEDRPGGQNPDDETSEDQHPDCESSAEEESDEDKGQEVSYSKLESDDDTAMESGKGKDDGDGSESESEGEFLDAHDKVSREGTVELTF